MIFAVRGHDPSAPLSRFFLRAAIFYGSSKVGYIFEKGGANNTTNQNYYEEASGGLKNMLFAPPPTSHVGTSRGAKGGVQGGGANYMTPNEADDRQKQTLFNTTGRTMS